MPEYYFCDYHGCFNRYRTGTSLSFFSVPIDKDLKLLWIKHSGNESLYKNPDLKKKIKFCEEHFCKDDLIVRSTNKVLKENSILKSANAKYCSCSSGSIDKKCEKIVKRLFINKIENKINCSETQNVLSIPITESETLATAEMQLDEKEIPIPVTPSGNDPLIINDIKQDPNPSSNQSSLSINCYQFACRICLKEFGINTKITDNFDPSDDGLKIKDVLQNCFKFENCYENDKYPKKICNICLNELHTVYNFYMKFSKSNDKLQMCPISNNEIKKELVDELNIDDYNNTVNETYLINGTNFNETLYTKQELTVDAEEDSNANKNDNTKRNKVLNSMEPWNKKYSTQKPLRTYMSSNQLYTCKFCDKKFNFKQTLDNHLKTHANGNNLYGEKCTICEADFNSKKELIIHIEKNHILYKFLCDVCKQGFTQQSSLDTHKLVHKNKYDSLLIP